MNFRFNSGVILSEEIRSTDTVVTAIEGERKIAIILHFYGKMLSPRFFMTKKTNSQKRYNTQRNVEKVKRIMQIKSD